MIEVTHSINNGTLNVGINSFYGAAIVRLSYQGRPNWVDNGVPDPGRQVQISLYDGSATYGDCWPCSPPCVWGWNPVQAGNCHGTSGVAQPVDADPTRIISLTQPLHWNPAMGRSNATVGQTLRFVRHNALQIEYTITNGESFTISGAKHELPVAYLVPTLGRAFRYVGGNPWEFSPAEEASVPVGPNQFPEFQTTEPWIAWIATDGVGLALYAPDIPAFPNWGWRFQRLQPPGTTFTNALQHFREITFNPSDSLTFQAFLVAGTVDEIRTAVYSIESDRQGWTIFRDGFETP